MIACCLKWVDTRPHVDPITGAVETRARMSGPSDADRAALEWALRIGEAWGMPVTALTAGPVEAEAVLREALGAGAASAVRIDLEPGASSEVVAAGLASACRGASAVTCGAWSADRGSGSVPAYIAAHLGAAQALGCVTMGVEPAGLTAERRLDGGRRELLRVPVPAVVSVEGGSARLRRASLGAVLASQQAAIAVLPRPAGDHRAGAVRARPFRPRARVLPAPPSSLSARERILALTGALTDRTPPQRVTLPPDEAADRIIEQLRTWGYLSE